MYKRVFLIVIIAWSILNAADIDISKFKNLPMLNNKTMKVVKAKSIDDGIYHLKLLVDNGIDYKEMDGFVTKNLNTIIIGKAYDVNNGKRIDMKLDMSKYQKMINMSQYKEYAAFSIGTGDKEYYVFIDPMCGYCKKFEEVSEDIAKTSTIYYFFFPLGINSNSRNISAYVMEQQKDKRSEMLKDIQFNNNNAYLNHKFSKKSIQSLSEQISVAKELKIKSTPTFLNAKGQREDWASIAAQNGANIPLRKDGLQFLKDKQYAITLGEGTKELYMFIDINKLKSVKMINSKKFNDLKKKYTINLFLLADDMDIDSRLKTAFIYNKKTLDNRRKAFFKMLTKHKLSKKDKDAITKELSESNNFALMMSVSLASKKTGVLLKPTIAFSNGTIVDFKDL